ncbi:GNAT family N-acetyltransferase [Actinokineospora guangxiensis]|uniref:GNAT family N-acetyltransferase n=1 Tax=Actinokineospora guangxiensis TaxID=1490288 RepID=A0ABW0EWF5_9PSEU
MFSSERLTVRRFRAADAPAFAAYRSEPDVAHYQSWSAPFPDADARRLVAEFATDDPRQPGWFQYAVELRATGELVGDVAVGLHENLRQADLGFTVAPAHQRRGYAREAVTAVLGHLFTERGLLRVAAECDARNTASAALLAALGFRREGLRREHTLLKGEWTDDLLFGLLAREWPG